MPASDKAFSEAHDKPEETAGGEWWEAGEHDQIEAALKAAHDFIRESGLWEPFERQGFIDAPPIENVASALTAAQQERDAAIEAHYDQKRINEFDIAVPMQELRERAEAAELRTDEAESARDQAIKELEEERNGWPPRTDYVEAIRKLTEIEKLRDELGAVSTPYTNGLIQARHVADRLSRILDRGESQ